MSNPTPPQRLVGREVEKRQLDELLEDVKGDALLIRGEAGIGKSALLAAVHLVALTAFKDRIAVLFNWTVASLGRGRQQSTITAQQVFARQSFESQDGQIRSPSFRRPSSRSTMNPTALERRIKP